MSLYEENIALLEQEFSYIKIEQQEDVRQKIEVLWEESAVQERIMGIHKGEETFYLNSRYEAEVAARQWAEQFENVSYRTKFFVMGIGNGSYLKVLHEKYPENMIICCEIYPELEDAELRELDFSELLAENIFLVLGKERIESFKSYLGEMISYADCEQMVFCAIPNYSRIDSEMFTVYRNMYIDNMESLVYCRNTQIADEQYRRDSFLNNLFVFPRCCSLGQLIERMEGIDVSDRAAIVVSAGPSLDKNIHLLKEAKGKALLIAVDAAAKPMVKAGVYPDLIATIDPIKDEEILQEGELLDCPMVASVYSHYRLTRQHRGSLYFATSENEYFKMKYAKYGHKMYRVPTGGSVANNAYSLGMLLGFKTIILVGQDLAYPNGKIHAQDAVYKNCLENAIDTEETGKYFAVEANEGGTILTEANMDAYRKWFEEQNAKGEIRMINATEGGAKIKGAEYRTLKSALEECCEGKEDVDFAALMRSEEAAFTEQQQKEIFAGYVELEKSMDVWEKRLKKGIAMYQKLDLLNRKGKYHISEYKRLTEEIGILTREFNQSEVVHLLNQWGNKEEYEVLDTLADTNDSVYDEVKIIVDGGIKMCETYLESSKQFRVVWDGLLVEYGLKK